MGEFKAYNWYYEPNKNKRFLAMVKIFKLLFI